MTWGIPVRGRRCRGVVRLRILTKAAYLQRRCRGVIRLRSVASKIPPSVLSDHATGKTVIPIKRYTTGSTKQCAAKKTSSTNILPHKGAKLLPVSAPRERLSGPVSKLRTLSTTVGQRCNLKAAEHQHKEYRVVSLISTSHIDS